MTTFDSSCESSSTFLHNNKNKLECSPTDMKNHAASTAAASTAFSPHEKSPTHLIGNGVSKINGVNGGDGESSSVSVLNSIVPVPNDELDILIKMERANK